MELIAAIFVAFWLPACAVNPFSCHQHRSCDECASDKLCGWCGKHDHDQCHDLGSVQNPCYLDGNIVNREDCPAPVPLPGKHNIIHIIVDDLRPELGAYGLPNRHTPNIDKLAAGGVVFERAYTQQAICGPSRNSFLSGRRPDSSRTWNFINHFREDHPEWTSIPGLFARDPNAVAVGSGKSYHPKMPPQYDGNKSWSPLSVPLQNPCWDTAHYPWIPDKWQDGGLPCKPCFVDIKHYTIGGNISVANEFCATDAEEDTQTIDHAIELLRQVADQHFYLAVGMHKPHIPWQYAQEDLDQHPLENIDLPRRRVPPTNVPDIALQTSDKEAKDVNGHYHTTPYTPLSDNVTRQARRQYRAATTGMDRKLGKLLDELDTLGLTDNTAVILNADHGWHLGDEGEWRKMTNFETDTRVPLIIRAPWVTKGGRAAGLVELLDLAPTIAELAGLSLPPDETAYEGTSLVPMLKNTEANVKQAAFSQYPKAVKDKADMFDDNAAHHRDRSEFTHMGYTVRTDDWRYTEWRAWNGTSLTAIWDMLVARELYDHRNEVHYPTKFDAGESINLANEAEYADVVASHSKLIRAMFDASRTDSELIFV